jgi:hypothetical protein
MRCNFLGPEEVSKHYGVSVKAEIVQLQPILPGPDQYRYVFPPRQAEVREKVLKASDVLAKIPFSESTLKKCRNSHVLVAGYPLSIVDIASRIGGVTVTQSVVPPVRQKTVALWFIMLGSGSTKAAAERAAKQRVDTRWYLIRKTIAPGSLSKHLGDQEKCLSVHDEIPRACEVIYATILHFLVTGERLFEDVLAGCRGEKRQDLFLHVGLFDRDFLRLTDHYGNIFNPMKKVGLASARKRGRSWEHWLDHLPGKPVHEAEPARWRSL